MGNLMNPEIKAEWVKALRSGEYKQGKGYLRSANDCFCCLGVLCDLYTKCGASWEKVGSAYKMEGASRIPPDSVIGWSGLTYDYGLYLCTYAEKNDGGWTFPQIADLIEKDL